MGLQCAVASAGPYANNLHLAPDNTSSLNFYRSDALPAPNQQCHSTEGTSKHCRHKAHQTVQYRTVQDYRFLKPNYYENINCCLSSTRNLACCYCQTAMVAARVASHEFVNLLIKNGVKVLLVKLGCTLKN